ncbi:MAG: YceG family protein [Bacillota bacterium]
MDKRDYMVQTIVGETSDLFKDLLIPISERKGFVQGETPIVPVYFYRVIGIKDDKEKYYEEIRKLDGELQSLDERYLRLIMPLTKDVYSELVTKTSSLWNRIVINGQVAEQVARDLQTAHLFTITGNDRTNQCVMKGFTLVLEQYLRNTRHSSPTTMKNFCLKLLTWMHQYLPQLLKNFDLKSDQHNPKIISYGDIKEHEIYFLLLLSKIGCDVVYINTMDDGKFTDIDKDSQYSKLIAYPTREALREFPYGQKAVVKKQTSSLVDAPRASNNITAAVDQEKTFEELAQMSKSVVMIKVYSREDEVVGRGSGVVIDDKGLIATNFHVIKDGFYYGIVFEGLEQGYEYKTYTLLNTDPRKDLALIKIHLNTVPIKTGSSQNLKRGQKVVAIGSPLGLMNTISDGIISGFRQGDGHDFIQTTAPMSPGSSGGALLNMKGELIGIASAGYIDGQNINLAVPSWELTKLLENEITVIQREIMERYGVFSYEGFQIHFDGFFESTPTRFFRICLYQSKQDRTDFSAVLRSLPMIQLVEHSYMNNMKRIAEKYGIQQLAFELGGKKNVFTFTYNSGRITDKKWDTL